MIAQTYAVAVVMVFTTIGWAPAASATDRPIAARKLTVRHRGGDAAPVLTFVANDPTALFPEIGSDNDPAANAQLLVTVFTQSEPPRRVQLAPGPGTGFPGWRTARRSRTFHVYKAPYGESPARLVLLDDSGRIKLRLVGIQLDMSQPLGRVAISIRSGSVRNCALFTGDSIRRDRDGAYVATKAPAPLLPDCSDETLSGALGELCGDSVPECGGYCPGDSVCAASDFADTCRCIPPDEPCGGTAPVCGGPCPEGETCFAIESGIPESFVVFHDCVCSPPDVVPCGAVGGTACPDGASCVRRFRRFGSEYYECIDDNAVCGEPGYGSCPPDLQCLLDGLPGDILTYRCRPFELDDIV